MCGPQTRWSDLPHGPKTLRGTAKAGSSCGLPGRDPVLCHSTMWVKPSGELDSKFWASSDLYKRLKSQNPRDRKHHLPWLNVGNLPIMDKICCLQETFSDINWSYLLAKVVWRWLNSRDLGSSPTYKIINGKGSLTLASAVYHESLGEWWVWFYDKYNQKVYMDSGKERVAWSWRNGVQVLVTPLLAESFNFFAFHHLPL